jgi:predicted nucleic acid-binding protein
MAEQVLLDTNFFVDNLLRRQPFLKEAQRIWQACEQGLVIGCITTTSLTDIFYLAAQRTDKLAAFRGIRLCVRTLRLIGVGSREVELALNLAGDDFEDNLQLACAINAKLDAVVTRDRGFPKVGFPILTFAALLKQIGW